MYIDHLLKLKTWVYVIHYCHGKQLIGEFLARKHGSRWDLFLQLASDTELFNSDDGEAL